MIIDLAPCNYASRIELAIEIQKILRDLDSPKILEIGCGEGDSTKYILDYNKNARIDALDISQEMLDSAKEYLGDTGERVDFICSDVSDHLKNSSQTYNIVTFSWVLHNFTRENQKKVFEELYDVLKSGGKMVFMEKLYPDNPDEAKKIFDRQMWRYDQYLPGDIAKEIIEHETLDLSPEYIMKENETIKSLESMGFKNIKVVDRIEQVVVLIAEK